MYFFIFYFTLFLETYSPAVYVVVGLALSTDIYGISSNQSSIHEGAIL